MSRSMSPPGTVRDDRASPALLEPIAITRPNDEYESHSRSRSTAGGSTLVARIPPFIIRFGSGIRSDIAARLPYYKSDWTDAWNYRVVPATALIFFANVLPGVAFSLALIETTGEYGVSEVLLSSFMAAFVFSVFGAQPLTIAGVTGPITVFNKTIYNITQHRADPPNYLHFVGWVYLWGAILHWITASLNWCNFLRYVTLFSCDTFGFYVACVYLQYGIQVVTREFDTLSSFPGTQDSPGALLAIVLALLMLTASFLFQSLSQTTLFHRHVRRFFADYGMPISLVAASGVAYWGRFSHAGTETLPVGKAFMPANDRPWLVKFWELDGMWVGVAFPFGLVLWVLFFFDHNVSSLMAQGSEFPLRKPPGFHYDFFLLGITTFIAGLLGVPAPNGLIPQAPIHTTSLLILGHPHPSKENLEATPASDATPEQFNPQNRFGDCTMGEKLSTGRSAAFPLPERDGGGMVEPNDPADTRVIAVGVVEQRVSNLAQGALCLVLLTGPFLHVLSLVPRGVLAGLFWYMGSDALKSNGITTKLLFLLRDRRLTPADDPLNLVRKSRILIFCAAQLLGFGATFAITQTIAAIGFPIIVLLLIPLRALVIPMLGFTPEELGILDGPTASSFTMASVGGSF